jgi:hypothetical protein
MAAADGKLRVSNWKQAWNQFNKQNREKILIEKLKVLDGSFQEFMHVLMVPMHSQT